MLNNIFLEHIINKLRQYNIFFSLDNYKCGFCQKCTICMKNMILILKQVALKKFNKGKNEDLFMLNVIPGMGGDDTKDLTNIIFNLYCYSLSEIDNISVDEDNKTIFFTDNKIFQLIKLSEEIIYKIIRISPFSNKKQTSLVCIRLSHSNNKDQSDIPDIDINKIKFQYTRSSGAGGQHANKTSSCVIATDTNTGIHVRISQERNQHTNKALAIKALNYKVMSSRLANIAHNNKQDYKSRSKMIFGGNFDRVINLHKEKYIKIRNNKLQYNIDSIENIMLIRLIFDNVMLII